MDVLEWLNARFLASSLEADEGKVEVFEYVIEPAVPDGSNWFSSLYRVSVKFKKSTNDIKSASFIVKAASKNQLIRRYTEDLKFFEHEYYIYSGVLPEIHRYLGDKTLSPKMFFSLHDNVLVLEDLKVSGYTLVDKSKQLDYDHTLSYVVQLAKFHAGTVGFHEKHPEYIGSIGKELVFTEDNRDSIHGKYYMDCLTLTVQTLEGLGGRERFCKKIRSVKDTLWDRLVTLMATERHVRVLNHGDASLVNALYKHDGETGSVVDVKLIDYQLIRYASPAVDLHYLFMTSVRPEVIWYRYDDLMHVYCVTFNGEAEKMKAKTRLSIEQLEDELKFSGCYAFSIACSLMPMIIADPKRPCKICYDRTDMNVDPFVKIYENHQFKIKLVELLEFLEERGYF